MTRSALVVACAAALLSCPAAAQDGGWSVRLDDPLVQPGDVLRVVVSPPIEAERVEGRWGGRVVPFTREGGPWFALLGVDVAEAPGSRVLALTASGPSGARLAHDESIAVASKPFRTRRLRVNPKFVIPPDSALPRITSETALLNALFRTSSTERWWRDGAVRPVEGVAVSGFGVRSILNGQNRGPHNGLDLAAGTGTPVYAPTPGVVAYAREFYYSGNTVILDHGMGLYSTMAHLSVIDVQEGQRVEQGTLLGKVGATGRVTGPHLHWAVRLHGARVDPLSLLEVIGAPAAR
ncbi:MAG: M23 family metallopeptidase [Vicinamibacterales bacterium]